MARMKLFVMIVIGLSVSTAAYAAPKQETTKKRIIVVSSYHADYSWSQETNKGFCAAMLKLGYFDDQQQVAEYTRNNAVETSRVVLRKLWMDAKRKKGREEKLRATAEITRIIKEFKPALIFLGDDDAAQFIGTQFLDTGVPIVMWGVNNTPVKYGLVELASRPGHNVTGVYQPGYYLESLLLLKKIVPSAKTFAVLTDDSIAGRSHFKEIEHLAGQKALPLKLVETVVTGDYEVFKARILELQTRVDAFFVAQYSSLVDKSGAYVRAQDIVSWYLANVKIPETAEQGQFVRQGMLCGADDSGFNQGYEAVLVANDILTRGANPATYPIRGPKRGTLMVNRERAKMLGIQLTPAMGIEEYFENAESLKDPLQ